MAETDDPYYTKSKIDRKFLEIEQIKNSINEGKNLVGKKEYFKKIDINENFPQYLKMNKEKYKNWIA